MRTVGILIFVILVTGCGSPFSTHSPQTHISTVSQDKALHVFNSEQINQAACHYLWQHQQTDGSWRSTKYGILSSGQAYTPFVLYALLRFDADPQDEGIKKALQFMRSKIRNGAIGLADPDVLEYPVYSTAYALMCFKLVGLEHDQALIQELEQFLISQQFTEQNGFEPEHVAYGGWGFGGDHPHGQTGHMDLAHVRRVLDALSLNPCQNNLAEVKRKAATFLKMVQKHPSDKRPQPLPIEFAKSEFAETTDSRRGYDGGFYFSPVVLRANKGRLNLSDSPSWNSYSTATCDGLLALLKADVPLHDDRVSSAMAWLKRNQLLSYPQKIPESYQGENWREAVWFYHISVRGEVARAIGDAATCRRQISELLSTRQNSDGSFSNQKSSLMKEDDPILSTTLAIIGLGKA